MQPPQRRGVHGLALAAGPLAAVAVWLAPRPDALDAAAWGVAGVAAWMVLWWLLDPVPRSVTAILPLVLFGPMGVQSMGEVASSYAHPLLVLMGAGFVVGHAMERVALHARLTAWILQPAAVRRGPGTVMAALMAVTAGLSGLISNTATMLMMLPLAGALAAATATTDSTRRALVLGIAYACSIGGMTTLVGTPPNAVLAGVVADLLGGSLGFATWMLVGVPAAACMLPTAWWVLCRTHGLPARFATPLDRPVVPAARPGERVVVGVVVVALLAWLSRGDKDLGVLVIPGWARLVPGKGYELDAAVALVAAFALILWPTGRDDEGRPTTLVDWRRAERAVPWSVLLLLGGGFALADAIAATGLTDWIAQGTSVLGDLGPLGATLVVCATMTLLTEITSNTATAQVVLPVLAVSSQQVGLDPMVWLVPATLSASCAFMLPVATAPNAIAAEAGDVRSADMAWAGAWVNLAGVAWLTLIGWLWVPWVFGA